jgi:formate--tetrahydrofolate ligase
VGFAVNNAFNEGGSGAEELARLVVDTIDNQPSEPLQFTYPDEASVEEKALAVCQKIYGADGVTFSPQAKKMIERIKELGITNYPICIAKTQYSFSADAKAYGCPTGFNIHIRDIVVNCGAEMLVLVAGDIMRMPGLPRSPQAERIDLIDGEIVGLS